MLFNRVTTVATAVKGTGLHFSKKPGNVAEAGMKFDSEAEALQLGIYNKAGGRADSRHARAPGLENLPLSGMVSVSRGRADLRPWAPEEQTDFPDRSAQTYAECRPEGQTRITDVSATLAAGSEALFTHPAAPGPGSSSKKCQCGAQGVPFAFVIG